MKTRHPLHVYIAGGLLLPFFIPIYVAIMNRSGPVWLYVGIGLVWASLAAFSGLKGREILDNTPGGFVDLDDRELLQARVMKSFCNQSFGCIAVALVLVVGRHFLGL